jgi:hypothetical protein
MTTSRSCKEFAKNLKACYNLGVVGDEGFRQRRLAEDCKPRCPTLVKQGQLKITGEPQLALAA